MTHIGLTLHVTATRREASKDIKIQTVAEMKLRASNFMYVHECRHFHEFFAESKSKALPV